MKSFASFYRSIGLTVASVGIWVVPASSQQSQPARQPKAAVSSSASKSKPAQQQGAVPAGASSSPSIQPGSQDSSSSDTNATPDAASGQSLLSIAPLKITLTPSETPLKLGSNSNIAADIQNVSTKPVELDTTAIQLMVHAILSKTDSLCVLPLGPTTNTYLMGLLVLQPQDHLSVLFNLSQKPFVYTKEEATAIDQTLQKMHPSGPTSTQPEQASYQRLYQEAYLRSCNPSAFGPLERAIDFTPGNYEYFLTGKFSVCDPIPGSSMPICPYPMRSFAQSEKFPVGIDQIQIICFAIIGGILAYLVVAVRGDEGSVNQFFALLTMRKTEGAAVGIWSRNGLILAAKLIRDVLGVAILSSAFTIVSSRLSDSQFPIKVSVLDGWGAITIGFLSYFVGNKFIDSLRNMVK